MSRRNLLRKHLADAWISTIDGPYSEALINSERGLQVHFCVKLLTILANHKRRLFIEPMLVFPNGVTRSPDLVICNSRQIIGVVEFKYKPRIRPGYVKDIDTLARVAKAVKGEVTLSNERFRGPQKARIFSVAEDAVLCWAAVHSDKSFEIPPHLLEEIGGRYLELRAAAGISDVKILQRGT